MVNKDYKTVVCKKEKLTDATENTTVPRFYGTLQNNWKLFLRHHAKWLIKITKLLCVKKEKLTEATENATVPRFLWNSSEQLETILTPSCKMVDKDYKTVVCKKGKNSQKPLKIQQYHAFMELFRTIGNYSYAIIQNG
ncbi:hypothetical protein CDAR_274821 [Caerostris darwini]|uniref:Uncharacterized protein n=1 Tax=Caerostris darwini TaxID=1538125 RepID=A0AAV4VNR8_9ARAC|nr:hypothetical protein CDAR_274821 [Caerostris darwini]